MNKKELKTIQLPKIYENELGNYPQHKGKQKISYSQLNSFKDYKERCQVILNKHLEFERNKTLSRMVS